MYKAKIFSMVSRYTTIKDYYVKYKVAPSRIFEIMDEEKFSKEKFGTTEIKDIKGKIEIKNLNFAYDKAPILKDINITPLSEKEALNYLMVKDKD